MIEVEKVTCPACDCHCCLMLSVDNGQGGWTDVETAGLPLHASALQNQSLRIECGSCDFETEDPRICEARTTKGLEKQLRIIHRSMEKEQE